jgi:hypothetical protein
VSRTWATLLMMRCCERKGWVSSQRKVEGRGGEGGSTEEREGADLVISFSGRLKSVDSDTSDLEQLFERQRTILSENNGT